MACMSIAERNELIDMVAQAVIDKMEERERTNALADVVIERIMALQAEEAALREKEEQARRLVDSDQEETDVAA